MPEYVYALHDFLPEHEDEISFRAGQPIEVIEKDDMYSDGWWQGRNLAGKVGLFPQSYTTPAAPASDVSASSSELPTETPLTNASPESSQLPRNDPESSSLHESDSDSRIGMAIGEPTSSNGHGEVMKATMTDVQKAIEQLGKNDRSDSRSFSFASSRDGDTTDRETDTETETDGDAEDGGETWHRRARDKLAEQARKVVQAAADTESENTPSRSVKPPIEVEMSDESEGEDEEAFDHLHHLHFTREHPHIPEEDEDEEELRQNLGTRDHRRKHSNETSSAILPSDGLPSPVQDDSGQRTATVEKSSFLSSPSPLASSTPSMNQRQASSSPSLDRSSFSTNNILPSFPMPPVDAASIPVPVSPEPVIQVTSTPATREIHESSSIPSSFSPSSVIVTQQNSKHNSVASSGNTSGPSVPPNPIYDSPTNVDDRSKQQNASEWTVEEVVEWLKSKGFGQDVCDKFTEQEITGDVLLELDINLLKAEIGIVAFGKRMRIANAIAELRRPPSIVFSDHHSPSHLPSHSHSHSQSYSYSHSHSSSTQHSLNSPLYVTSMSSVMGPPGISGLSSTGVSINGEDLDSNTVASGASKAAQVGMVGLGLGAAAFAANGNHQKTRSGQTMSPPSDEALKRHSQVELGGSRDSTEEDRGALSEGETAASAVKQRRRLFGRSTESSSSIRDKLEATNTSKDAISPTSTTASPRPRKRESLDDSSIASRHSRNKRSVDGSTKGSERLSFFGGTLGKSRKPPPRITSQIIDSPDPAPGKSSTLSLRNLYGGRKTSGRPSTSDGIGQANPKKDEKEKEKEKAKEKELDFSAGFELSPKLSEKGLKEKESKDPAVLRRPSNSPSQDKRISSLGPSLKEGKSIFEQIGTPDHEGWMRKKADRYNSWKVRYFVIKGQDFYILRSNSKAETKIKGYINIVGYKVIADENIDPGRYGFRIVHETDKTHLFSSEEQAVVREWMKAIMKATIGRDYTKPVVSSVNIPTIPLTVAQAMNPAPRPPSPTARAATQKALRRENPNQLSTRDARVLMGLPSPAAGVRAEDSQETERARLDSFFANQPVSTASDQTEMASNPSTPQIATGVPQRPSREIRHMGSSGLDQHVSVDSSLIEWANSHLPQNLQVSDPNGPLYDGLAILRMAESILGKPTSPPVLDSAFPSGPNDDKLDGLFRLFDFLLDNDVKMGSVSINDVRQGKRDKIIQLLKALKSWEDRRRDILRSIGHSAIQAGPFMAPVGGGAWK
ncbi:hypothetical protein BJ138DRAFT_1134406 [Hygrophoropsis aurantiaca]|uniref:Uncharacterized protein n=1 Tax=Hygrophoropsis aurantiaca TaxID=72124 RepID=A0ACB8AIA9_9AGAM|nr:hypothetical protein BJ138DRAFT_1134406 [Hygrophoropsis aurantiaca]